MGTEKDVFYQALLDASSGDASKRAVLDLLLALKELSNPSDDGPDPISLDELVKEAAVRAAQRDPEHPLDQRDARKRGLSLFQDLERRDAGRLINGRRKSPTRFCFGSETGPGALRQAIEELAPQSWFDGGASRIGRPRRDDVVAQLKAKRRDLQRLGVSTLSLFGSVARDDARSDSDIDLLASFRDGATSDKYFGTKFFLEDLLGRRVDLVTDGGLREPIRQSIRAELIRVA